jgi:polysaccharide pyruvyl transferase CsaB
MKVVILAGDTDGNVGDRAIVLATCDEIRRHDPAVEITLASGRPEADRGYFGARTFPRGPAGLPKLLAAARRADLVLCGGGGLFQDDTSLVKMPYWALRLLAVRSVNRRVAGYSLGVGPLRWPASRFAARLAFACMTRVSVRDERARAVAQPLSRKPVHLVPDPALLLAPAPAEDARRFLAAVGLPGDGRPIVGVAARRWFHHGATLIPHKWAVKYRLRRIPGRDACERMTTLLAATLDRVAESHRADVLFLPTYNVSHEGDDAISREVMGKLRSARAAVARIDDPRLYKAVTGRLSVLLGSRMHPTIFAAAMGTPVIGLSYNPKFEGFFDLIERPDRVLRIEEFVEREGADDLAVSVRRAIDEDRSPPPRLPALMELTRSYTSWVLGRERSLRDDPAFPPASAPRAPAGV